MTDYRPAATRYDDMIYRRCGRGLNELAQQRGQSMAQMAIDSILAS
jgi:hypothetical protein